MIKPEPMDGKDGAREGEDDRNIRPRLDPFLQPPILKAFFEVLPLEELAKCRLVSKLWNKESLSTWRSKATLYFGKEGIVSTADDGSSLTTSVGEFLDLWEAEEWGSCPFRKFYFEYWKFEAGDEEQERFLELVGGHVTSLTLDNCSFVGRDNFRKIIYTAVPKLQFLSIDYCEVDNEHWHQPKETITYTEPAYGVHGLKSLEMHYCLPHLMMDMLSHFHKLESLFFVAVGEFYWDLLETIRLIRAEDQRKLPLKNFDVNFVFGLQSIASSIEELKLKDQLKLPLQRMDIWDGDEVEDCELYNADIIQDILQCHSSTLKYLELHEDDRLLNCAQFSVQFPFEKMEEFVSPSCLFANLNYLMYMPNLRVLDIWSGLSIPESEELFSNSTHLEVGDWTLPSLTELTFPIPLSVCNLRKLVKRMPNVERVWGLKLDDVKLAMVCNSWKHLKTLEDCGVELTDEGVIGTENTDEGGDDEETQGVPNITKLKNLTVFSTWSSKLTSACVYEGFLKLANLSRLYLGRGTELDDEAKAALERRKIGVRH